MAHTLLAFHAHPDDEALLTAGTMARAAAEGHRVIAAAATDGNEGLASSQSSANARPGAAETAAPRARALPWGAGRAGAIRHTALGLGPSTAATARRRPVSS